MEQNKLWILIARKLAGEATEAEKEELNKLLMNDQQSQYATEMMQSFWNMQIKEKNSAEEEEQFDLLWEKASAEENSTDAEGKIALFEQWENNHRQPVRRWPLLAIACSLLILISAGAWIFHHNKRGDNSFANISGKSEITTKYGSKSKIILPDGTSVWLNAGSHLTYKNNFEGGEREVALSGEAFFSVVHDAEHPFIIHTSKMNIEDLGTSFNVKAYPDDETTEATLIKGAIRITFPGKPKETVTLSPDQKLILYKEEEKVAIHKLRKPKLNIATVNNNTHFEVKKLTINPIDSSVLETSWLNNKLSFQSENFTDLAVQMERWYNVKIIFKNNMVSQYHFTGNFEDETVEQALKELQMIRKFHFYVNNNEITIY